MTRLNGKVILVTGGTSRLGKAMVQTFLSEGARVYFTWHQNQKAAQGLEAQKAMGFQTHLAKTADIEKTVQAFCEKESGLDVLIHNAAAVRDHTLIHMTEAEWDEVLAVNLKAPFYLTKKLLPCLERRKSVYGKILMVTSRTASLGGFGQANYAASKAGLNALMKSLAGELAPKKILVNAVNPGFMLSKMTQDLPKQVIEENKKASLVGEVSNSEEAAAFMVHLCSDEMTQITGQVFHAESRRVS